MSSDFFTWKLFYDWYTVLLVDQSTPLLFVQTVFLLSFLLVLMLNVIWLYCLPLWKLTSLCKVLNLSLFLLFHSFKEKHIAGDFQVLIWLKLWLVVNSVIQVPHPLYNREDTRPAFSWRKMQREDLMTDREDEVTTPTPPTALETSRAHKEQNEEARCKPPPVAHQRQYVDVLPP